MNVPSDPKVNAGRVHIVDALRQAQKDIERQIDWCYDNKQNAYNGTSVTSLIRQAIDLQIQIVSTNPVIHANLAAVAKSRLRLKSADCIAIAFEDTPGEVIDLHYSPQEVRYALEAYARILLYDPDAVFVTNSVRLRRRMMLIAAKIRNLKGELDYEPDFS